MANSAKEYANNVLLGYSNTIKRLKERYDLALSSLDREYDEKKKKITEEGARAKNEADASNKIALKNTKAGLLEKGLSHSGESVQAELDNNIARNIAMSQIDSSTSKSLSENEKNRADSKAGALSEFLKNATSAELKMVSEYFAQKNLDRDYEASRDDEIYDRFVNNRDYEASRDDEIYDRYVKNREFEASRDDEIFDRYVKNRDYKASRDDEAYDRYADNRDYEASRDDEIYDRYMESVDASSDKNETDKAETGVTGGKKTESGTADNRITPEISPVDFVDKIRMVHDSKYYESYYKRESAIREAIDKIVEDQTLTYEYRRQVKIYAQSIGIY